MAGPLSKNGHYRPNPRVICRVIENEAILLHLDSGHYFGFNNVGTRIWQLICNGHAISSIPCILVEEFEVERGEAEADTREFVRSLLEQKLVVLGVAAHE